MARRLGLGFAAIAIGTALVTGLLVNLMFSSRFDAYLAQQRAARVQQLAAAVATAYQAGGRWDTSALNQLGPAVAMSGADARLSDPAGALIWPDPASRTTDMAAMHRAMMPAGPLADPVTVPITVDGQLRGRLTVTLPEGTVPVADQQFRSSVNRLLLLTGLALAALASALGALLARRVTRPVAELTAAAQDLRAGDRSRRAQVTGGDEVARLAEALNELAASAERQEALRQAFTADVAHELRTPLAILRSHLEAVQDGVLELTPQLVASLHEETLRLGRLTADLETLTSAEAASFSLHPVRVDLAEVVRTVATGLQGSFAERQLRLELQLEPAWVCGDPTRLAQVLTNLLTNARKFVPPGGRVCVATQPVGSQVYLRVSDDGPGIPETELPHVFDRYFRGRAARANGSGIGLAVVAALVQAHGGEVHATNGNAGNSNAGNGDAGEDAAGGAVFTITLPTAGTAATASPSRAPSTIEPAGNHPTRASVLTKE